MKLSYYNFLPKSNHDGAILYNVNTGYMVKLDQAHYAMFEAFESQKTKIQDKIGGVV